MEVTRSGFIALVGRPNVGKSTLLNALLGEKVAIVSQKPQTTRGKVTGVLTRGDAQLIFLDTPGMHRAKTKLGEYMVKTVGESIADVDAAVLVVEPEQQVSEQETLLLGKLAAQGIPAVLAINKLDTLRPKEKLAGVIAAWAERFSFAAVVPVSAQTGLGIGELLDELAALLPPGPRYYPDDTLTLDPERAIAAEIIREKLLRLLSDEIPHGTAVVVEKMRPRPEGNITDVEATVFCEKESHKGIIIGRGGAMLKKIGSLARADIEEMLGTKVNLKIWVKVKDDWRNRGDVLKQLGYE